MRAILVLFLLLAAPYATLHAPDSVEYGESFDVFIVVHNPLNETVRADIVMVSPYKLSRTIFVDPGSEGNVSATIDSSEFRVGDQINVTVVIFFTRSEGSDTIVLKKLVSVVTESTNLTNIIIGLIIFTIGVSVIGYLALAIKKKREEKEEEHIRPPRL